MKNILLIIVLLATTYSFGQSPEGFNYQAVVRNSANAILANQSVGLQFTILQGSATGTAVYTETFSTTTTDNGLVNIEIGSGTTTDNFAAINWANGPYFIETAIDVTGGTNYAVMGTSQLVSVPYAMYAKTAESAIQDAVDDADNDPTNEIETWTTLAGIPADIADGDDVNDADNDPANEIETWTTLAGIPADIADGDDVNDADSDPTNEIETWTTLAGIPADIADGDDVNDADANPSNEIQTLSFSSNTLSLTSGGSVDLSAYATDNVNDADADATNEIQVLSISNDTLYLSNGGSVYLGNYTDASPISGTANYLVKFGTSTTGVNSLIRDNGTATSIGTSPNNDYRLYAYKSQNPTDGDGQAIMYAYRTRTSQNNGTAYGRSTTNTAVKGYNYWGDQYSFGLGGFSYNDYTRTGGVLGAYQSGTYWGSLGYKNSGSATYGIYGTSQTTGSGFLPSSEAIGVGGGFFGDLIGSTSQGSVIGQLNSGDLFAQYNSGNVYTLGQHIELVKTDAEVTPAFSVTSTEATVYTKGSVELVNGSAYVTFDGEYQALLGETPVVTVTPNGECNGLYISEVDQNGFTVKELMNGQHNVKVSWIAVGNRVDYNDNMTLATQIVSDPEFDRNIQQVLYSDGNLEGKAKGIWWDGTTIQFGVLPTHLSTVQKTPETVEE